MTYQDPNPTLAKELSWVWDVSTVRGEGGS